MSRRRAQQTTGVAATIFFGQASQRTSTEPDRQHLPQLEAELWAVPDGRPFDRGGVEDHYYLSLQSGVAARLGEALASPPGTAWNADELLPGRPTLCSYNLRDSCVRLASL